MTALTLRKYQQEAIGAVLTDWDSAVTPTAVVLPTGMGKTVIFSELANRWHCANDYRRVLVLVHRDELAQQAMAKLRAMLPPVVTVGRVQAEHDDTDADVIVASVQTLRSPARMARLNDVGMIVIDECHHAMSTSYLQILNHYGALEEDPSERTPCVGFTATLERTDGKGLGTIFRNVAYSQDIMYGIRQGYLADVRGLTVVSEGIDLSKVKRSHGDYDEGQLGEIMGQAVVCRATADAYLEHGGNQPGVLFAPTVASSYAMADAFNRAGVPTEVVEGTIPPSVRAGIYHRFRTGETRVLANCMVLTEGWDEPCATVAIMARPTTSVGLYQQCVGRVLRPFPGKGKALVLDVVGVAKRAKLVSLIDMSVWSPKEGETLLEAAEREMSEETEEGWGASPRRTKGPKYEEGGGLVEVNLFAASSTCWLQTRKGVWFIPTREKVWFLWEYADGTFGIATYDAKDYRSRPVMGPTGLPMGLAMGIAEQEATMADPMVANRASSWRKGNVAVTEPQRAQLARWGIPAEGLFKNTASDALSVAVASHRIDPWVQA